MRIVSVVLCVMLRERIVTSTIVKVCLIQKQGITTELLVKCIFITGTTHSPQIFGFPSPILQRWSVGKVCAIPHEEKSLKYVLYSELPTPKDVDSAVRLKSYHLGVLVQEKGPVSMPLRHNGAAEVNTAEKITISNRSSGNKKHQGVTQLFRLDSQPQSLN